MKHPFKPILLIITVIITVVDVRAQYPVDLDIALIGGGGSGSFAPYYIASNNHGKITQTSNALLDINIGTHQQVNHRLSYSWGIEAIGGYSSSTDYMRYDITEQTWINNRQHPPRIWLQQIFGRIDYRSLFITAGMVNSKSALLNNRLSSGDMTEGPNARPIPQIRVGFNDFQPIPFTNGWVEIQGEISYGKMADNDWIDSHYNHYNSHECIGPFYTYKRCYFRTKPSKPLTFTLGMQVAGFFGGTTTFYDKGNISSVEKHKSGLKEFFKMLIPTSGDETFYLGNTLGSWDIMLTYRTSSGATFKGYLEKPWETGSGIGFLNGFDGLWGIEYKAPENAPVDGVVLEYFDTTNQSGPIHFHPGDFQEYCPFPYDADGGDDTYNNYTYNAYTNYGMSLGSPMLRSTIYNRDGYLEYIDNVVRGFHAGISGTINSRLSYRLLGGYRKGWGAIRKPRTMSVHDTSVMAEAIYTPALANNNLTVTTRIAIDRGTMYGNTLGALVTVNYHTNLNIGSKR